MKMFQVLQALDKTITARRCKLHLARWNGTEDPLDVYLAGNFDEWQEWQNRGNFTRELVVSLIEMSEPHHWLFAGVHAVAGWKPVEGKGTCRRYSMSRCATTDSICGRMIIEFERPSRQSYLNAERWQERLRIAELRAERLQVIDFPGYTKTMLTKKHLDIVVNQQNPSWRSALSSVNGVYVISDRKTGKLYVGSAIGENGIWGRWCAYAKDGHGGNKELRCVLRENGSGYADYFQFGVLETADTRATIEDILERESHWKELLLTRTHGYNAN